MVAPVLASPGRHGASLPLHTGRLTALVLGTNYRALGVVRSLGRHGVASWVVKQDSHALASRSRHAERTLPWPKGDDAGKVEYLKLVASSNSIRQFLLIPTDDECTTLVSKWHDHLEADFVLTTPAWESLQWACDKRMMYQLGEQLGIDQPRTSFPGLGQGLNSGEFRFPVILKPAIRSVLNPLALDKAWRIDNPIDAYKTLCRSMWLYVSRSSHGSGAYTGRRRVTVFVCSPVYGRPSAGFVSGSPSAPVSDGFWKI